MEDTTTWTTAPYGRACAGCAQAKCKCLLSEQGVGCARCRRLNKECRPVPRTRKHNPTGSSVVSRTRQLERKLDGIVSLLQASGQPHITQALASSMLTTANPRTVLPGFDRPHSTQGPSPANTSPRAGSDSDIHGSRATDDEILSSFRLEKLPYLPLMYIPATTRAAAIKEKSPFLWHCIAILHQKNVSQKVAYNTEVRKMAAELLLVDCERSLSLLQGLLIYLGWVIFESPPQKHASGPFMQMAISLVLDLGLNKPPPQGPNMSTSYCVKAGHLSAQMSSWISTVRSMDERRAVLGCYILTSSASHFLGRTDPLRWTPHMKECLDVLAESKEAPSDQLLVHQVRTQLLIDKVLRGLANDSDCLAGSEEPFRAPPSFYTKALYSQLQDIKQRLPPQLNENKVSQLHLLHAEIVLYETSLLKPTGTAEDVDLCRLNNLYACLNAIKKWFQVIFSFPLSENPSFPTTIFFSTAHCLIVLFRLSTFEYPGWDLAAVRKTIDLLSTTQEIADRFFQVSRESGYYSEGPEVDSFTKKARVLLNLRSVWSAKLAETMNPPTMSPVGIPPLPDLNEPTLDPGFSWSDFNWWFDITETGYSNSFNNAQ